MEHVWPRCRHRLVLKNYKRSLGALLGFPGRCAAHTSSSLLLPKPQAWCHRCPFSLTTLPIIMFSKIVLTALLIGAFSVNALTVPVARSPVPEPECESRRLFSAISNHGLTFVPFNSPTTRGPGPPQSLLGPQPRPRGPRSEDGYSERHSEVGEENVR